MNLDDKLIELISPIVTPCVPAPYTGEAGEYCEFDYDPVVGIAGDDECEEGVARVRVRYFAPLKAPTTAKRRALRRAIAAVDDFSLPSEQNASDEIGQAYLYTFEALLDEEDLDG